MPNDRVYPAERRYAPFKLRMAIDGGPWLEVTGYETYAQAETAGRALKTAFSQFNAVSIGVRVTADVSI